MAHGRSCGRLTQHGDEALRTGHSVSARNAYLRAAEYSRQAFFIHRDDLGGKELQSAYRSSVAAFRAALPLLDEEAGVLSGGLSGYLFSGADAIGPRPTILHMRIRRDGGGALRRGVSGGRSS
jgi:hypothetical protein